MKTTTTGEGNALVRAARCASVFAVWITMNAGHTLFAQGGGGDTSPPQPPPPGYHEPGPGVTVKENVMSDKDKTFLEKAASSGIKEVAVSQAVLSRLKSAEAREFAEKMIADHTAANNELKALAKNKFVPLPAETDADEFTEKWGEKSGDLDKAYLKEMVSDHKDAVKLFEKGAKADDPDIAAFASKLLPKLKHHLQEAERRLDAK